MKKIKNRLTYKKSGVDIKKADSLISSLANGSQKRGVLSGIGGFASLFQVDTKKYKNPVIVCGTDGVGTKLKIANYTNQHNHIGQDLVAMCVNDVLTTGADPILFLDYFATGSINLKIHKKVLKSIQKSCNNNNLILIGGETAEMPGMYKRNEYDLAGFCVGIIDKKKILDKKDVKKGDILVGIKSSGVHSNGYSLINKLIEDKKLKLNEKIGVTKISNILIKPTIIYTDIIKKIRKFVTIKSMSHITGGGITENLPRIIPKEYTSVVYKNSWKIPKIFTIIQERSNMNDEELLKIFNCGIGMVLVIAQKDRNKIISLLSKNVFKGRIIGKVASKLKNDKIRYE